MSNSVPSNVYPSRVDDPVRLDANFPSPPPPAWFRYVSTALRTLQQQFLAALAGGIPIIPQSAILAPGQSVITSSTTLASVSQWAPFDSSGTASGLTIGLPPVLLPSCTMAISDVGGAARSKPALISSSAWPIRAPWGPNQGKLVSSFVFDSPFGSLNLSLVPGNSQYGLHWIATGDSTLPSFVGVLTGSITINVGISQWLPFDSSGTASGLTIGLPSTTPPLQIPVTDVGGFARSKPATLAPQGGLLIYNLTGPNAGKKMPTWNYDAPYGTALLNLCPGWGSNPPFWMPT